MLAAHEHRPDLHQMLKEELECKSLYHVVLDLLADNTGTSFAKQDYRLNHSHQASQDVVDAWIKVYKNPKEHWNLYELAEKLVDLEDYFRRWRFNHVTTVERIIGFKRGTGGTSGVKYLRSMLEVELFPELWTLRGSL